MHCLGDDRSAESFPCIEINMGLTQYAAECANRNFGLLGNDGSVDNAAPGSDELDVTSFLTCFGETRRLKPALDLAK